MGAAWILRVLVLTVAVIFHVKVSAYNLTILHTNDVHARVEETNKRSGACSEEDDQASKCFGGFARIKTKADEIRGETDNVLFLDGGDQSQGTIWFFKFPNTTIPLMELVGYDAMTLGNHEFDNGVDALVTFLKDASFPILSCNLDMSKTPGLAAKVQPSKVFTKGGQHIGVVGYTTVETAMISQPGDVGFNPEVAAVQAAVNDLKAKGINKIIAVGHAGITVDSTIAKQVRGVDVVVGGHTNTFLYTGTPPSIEEPDGVYPRVHTNPDGEKVLVVQDYAYGKYLGHLEVEFDDQGVVKGWGGNPILLDKDIIRSPEILIYTEDYRDELEKEKKTVVGRTRVHIKGDRSFCRKEECNMGNMLTDAMVQDNMRRSDSANLSNVVIALINGGGIRASMEKGDITVENVLSVQPFRNTVDVVEVTGQTIHDALEFCASKRVETGDLYGGFIQASGMKIVYDMRKPVNQRVVEVKVVCAECEIPEYQDLDKSQVYKVLMSTFMANGGDGYTVIRDNIIKSHMNGDVDSTIALNYIKQYSPLYPKLEGRIRFLSNKDDREPCPVSREPCPVSQEPCPVSWEPCPVSREPCPVSREPCPSSPEPCPGSAGFMTSSVLFVLTVMTTAKLFL